MTTYSYPMIAVIGDYFRAATGLVISIVPLYLISRPLVTYLFGAMVVVFFAFGLRTLLRQKTRIEVTEEGIAVNLPSRRQLSWRDLEHLRIKYFSTRRNKLNGWMQLSLVGGGQAIRVDSKVDGFRDILDRATRAAAANGVALDEVTAANMAALDRLGEEAI